MASCRLLLFCFKACDITHPIFGTVPIECKCRTMVEWSRFITFAISQVDRRGSLRIEFFKRFLSNLKGLSEGGMFLMSKRHFLKRENHFRAVLFSFPYTIQMFRTASAEFVLLLNTKRRTCRKCSTFPSDTSFFKVKYNTYCPQK